MSTTTDISRTDLPDGSSMLAVRFDDTDLKRSVEQQLRQTVDTPTPSSGRSRDGGPVGRATNAATVFGIGALRTIGLQAHEMGDAIRKRRRELYRNEFPVLKPRFTTKCEACETEFDEGVEECEACGHDELRRPDPEEKRAAQELFESVNDEGQSLRDLARYCEPDQWLAGVSCVVVTYRYHVAQDSRLYRDGEVIAKEPQELLYGDPAAIKPVVDDRNRVGGHWWTCPVHRQEPKRAPGHCEQCNAERREVYFYEKRQGGADNYYFRDEVVTWANPMPRLNGLDGLAPAVGIVKRQVVLEMMLRYSAAFYDQDSDRLPNQMMILHTTNADHWEEQLERLRDENDPYDSPVFTNEYSPQDSSTPEVQVIDAMPDQILGQSDQLKKDYKEDIRQAFEITDILDSDLQDAGGLNNEGLQLEVTDRSIASQQHDYEVGWLDTLAKRLGIEDWYISFLPPAEDGEDALATQREIRSGQLAAEAGLDARWEDGDLAIDDGDFDAPPEDAPAGPDQPAADAMADVTQAAGLTSQQTADALSDAFRHIVWADPATTQHAQPFWRRDEDVPANVQRFIDEGINDADLTMADDVSASTLTRFFRDKLTQRQGWSLQSLTDDLVHTHDLERDYARTVARSGAARILTNAKLRAFAELEEGSDEEILYFWRGPADDDTTDGCRELKELTNPEFGGTPRPLEEFQTLQREIHDEHFPGLTFDESALHPQERHTVEAIPASAVAS